MSSKWKRYILISIDLIIIWISTYSSYVYRFGGDIPFEYLQQCIVYAGVAAFVSLVTMYYLKLYNRMWQYASIGEGILIVKAVLIITVVSYITTNLLSSKIVPLSIALHIFETALLLMGGVRIFWRVLRDYLTKNNMSNKKALIIGAGDCGSMIAREMRYSPASGLEPTAFIDDDPKKHNQQIHGVPVVGGREKIQEYVRTNQIQEIIIAMPSVAKQDVSKLIDICKVTKAKLKIIPHIGDLINGKVTIQEIRNVEVEDLLARDPVHVDLSEIANYVGDKIVLVTGAGGSIGSELCRQITKFNPRLLLLLGQGENSIYTIEMELRQSFPNLTIEPIIADVKDRKRIEAVFREFRPQVVFHAAAHKHVPLMEKNPIEAIKNNVFGTRNVAECSDQFGVERFVLISSDKAVNPTSVMGTTKRIAEMVIQSLNSHSRTQFVAVRFGNVLGSRGSVIPNFKQQIAAGGPVTVTHPEMVRYFMTIPEAVQLVIQAGGLARGGEVFILDMGKPVKIVDLANDLIRLSGFEPGVDIQIQYSGIRPGEKLFEELLTKEEGITSTKHNRIFISKPEVISPKEMEFELKKFERLVSSEQQAAARDLLQHIVPTYQLEGKDKRETTAVRLQMGG